MSILPCSVFIFIFISYIYIHSCNAARPSAMLLHADFAENKVVDSSMDQGTNVGVGVGDVAKALMQKAEDYSSNRIQGHVRKMKVNGRKQTTNIQNSQKIETKKRVVKKQNDHESLGFDSADYSQPRTHPPSHN